MFTILLFSYILMAVSFVLIGTLVLLKNSTIKLNRIFFCFSLSIALWMITNYFSNNFEISKSYALVANHTVLFFAGLAMFFIFKFITTIGKVHITKRDRLLSSFLLLAYSLALSPLVVANIHRQDEVYAITFGSLGYVYFAALLGNALLIFIALGRGVKRSRGDDRSRMMAILWSIVVWLIINLITNALLPLLNGSFNLTSIGPLTSFLVVFGLSYAIIKQRLFDIRVVIARSLAYVLSLGTLITVFSVSSSLIMGNVFNETSTSILITLINAVIFAVAILIYQPIKLFFDKITNRIFYRDAYDPQVVLNELNGLITSTIDLDKLVRNSVTLLGLTVKSGFCAFVLVDEDGNHQAFSSRKVPDALNELSKDIEKILQPHHPVMAEDLEDQEHLKVRMAYLQIELVVPMYAGEAFMGFIMFGTKQNGIVYSRQDVQLLTLLADSLSVAVQNALRFKEIENFNRTLQDKVASATRQLRRTNDKLTALDEAKDDFISMASHQLRTPLTAIKGYTSMVLEGDAGKITAEQRKLLTQSAFSAQRMVYLIADLLNVSRLRTGKFVIDAAPLNLAKLVGQELDQLRDTAKARSVELTYDKPAHFPEAMLDETKLRQVIMNFVDNAIYYTPAGGHITIEVIDKPQSIELRVTDDGIGVPHSEQPHLFTKFYRAPNARQARPDGTGLGLFMAKKVIIAQGGSIIFHSREGHGSTFGFSFSKARVAVPKQ